MVQLIYILLDKEISKNEFICTNSQWIELLTLAQQTNAIMQHLVDMDYTRRNTAAFGSRDR